MTLRFKLRSLLIAVTLIAAFCTWRTRPAIVADKFVTAVEHADFETAGSLFVETERDSFAARLDGNKNRRVKAWRDSQSVIDWLRGECTVHLVYEESLSSTDESFVPSHPFTIKATASGLRDPDSDPLNEI